MTTKKRDWFRSGRPPGLFLAAACGGLLAAAGCAGRMESLMEDPGQLLVDPAYAEYERRSGELETQYLNKEITYAEYQAGMKVLNDQYKKTEFDTRKAMEGPDVLRSGPAPAP